MIKKKRRRKKKKERQRRMRTGAETQQTTCFLFGDESRRCKRNGERGTATEDEMGKLAVDLYLPSSLASTSILGLGQKRNDAKPRLDKNEYSKGAFSFPWGGRFSKIKRKVNPGSKQDAEVKRRREEQS